MTERTVITVNISGPMATQVAVALAKSALPAFIGHLASSEGGAERVTVMIQSETIEALVPPQNNGGGRLA